MASKARRNVSKAKSAPQRAQKAMAHEARALYAEVRDRVRHLETSIREIQRGLRRAERKLVADARAQIRELRRGRTHSGDRVESEAARGHRYLQVAVRSRGRLLGGHQWRTVDAILVDARATATAAVERFRGALGGSSRA